MSSSPSSSPSSSLSVSDLPRSAEPSLLQLLIRAARAFEDELNRELRARLGDELRPAHYAVFRYLDPAGSRVGALAEAAGMTQQSMGELIGQLERAGLVRRRVDPTDRRARLVECTEAGIVALRIAGARIARIEEVLRVGMGVEEFDEMRHHLGLVIDVLTRGPVALTEKDRRPLEGNAPDDC